jgi:WD40 repeat protein
VWDAKDGKLVATLQGHTGSVLSAEFSADGTRVVTASEDHTARLWPVTYVEGLRMICAIISGSMQHFGSDRDELSGICNRVPARTETR